MMAATTKVIQEIETERRRQIDDEEWPREHDDGHTGGELAKAAACYAVWDIPATAQPEWPWDEHWWRPKSKRRNLVRAAALIVAEIERLDRQQ